MYAIVDTTDIGLPLGFYTSQWLANWYLTELDHYIKEVLKAKYYVRYMDDMVIFGSNKRELHKIRIAIDAYLHEKLGLRLKETWQVYLFNYVKKDGSHVGRDLDFMGFRFYRDRTILRKSIMMKATRKARKMCKKPRKSIHDCRQMLSYLGWFDCTDTYSMYKRRIKPFVSFRQLKQRESYNARKRGNVSCGNTVRTATM